MRFWEMNRTPITNEAGQSEEIGEIYIYGIISEDAWWYDEVTPREFQKELKALGDVKNLHVHINSYGGHYSAGTTIYSLLKQHKAKVTVYVDGYALSAASIIAMAGDVVLMPGNSMMMIHNARVGASGEAKDLRKAADILDKIQKAMMSAYTAKTGLTAEELKPLLDAETWMTADEAYEKGFVDEVTDPILAVACATPGIISMNGQDFNLAEFKNAPKGLMKKIEREVKNMAKEPEEKKVVTAAPAAPAAAATPAEPTQPAAPAEDVVAKAKADGAAEERARIAAINELSVPGAEETISKAIADGTSVADAAVEIVKTVKAQGNTAFQARKDDAAKAGAGDVGAAVTEDGMGKGEQPDAVAKAAAPLNEELKKRRGQK